VVEYIRDAGAIFRRSRPGIINYVGGAAEAKLQLPEMQSERRPDLSIYLNPPPTEDAQPWDEWVPDILIEVVSASSEHRDYEIKPPEYHRAGVKLYGIFDPFLRRVIALNRRGDSWRKTVLGEDRVLTTPRAPRPRESAGRSNPGPRPIGRSRVHPFGQVDEIRAVANAF